jgi:uncharacterized protein YndB with AHSA1/START domain
MSDVITRTFAAPRELVYAAFTDASHLANGMTTLTTATNQ